MAAPETPHLKQLRWTLIVHLVLLTALTALMGPLVAIARLFAAIAWLGLALGSLMVGTLWLIMKDRADNAWLMRGEEE
jgi:hypothetical protein